MKTFARVGTLGFEMALSVAVGYFGGRWLDENWGTEPWLMWIGLAAGIGAACKSVIRVLKTVRKDLQDNRDDSLEPRDHDE